MNTHNHAFAHHSRLLSRLRPVAQQGSMGCGVACVAALLSESYEAALKRFREPGRHETLGFPRQEIQRVLADVIGLAFAVRPLRGGTSATRWQERWATIPLGAVVCISRHEGDRYLHYVVKGHHAWMDPWANLRGKGKKANVASAQAKWRSKLPPQWRPLSVVEMRT